MPELKIIASYAAYGFGYTAMFGGLIAIGFGMGIKYAQKNPTVDDIITEIIEEAQTL